MLAKAVNRDLEFALSHCHIALSHRYFGHQLVPDCDIFRCLILGSYFQQPLRVFAGPDRKSTRLNSSHSQISYAVFCLKKTNPTNSQSLSMSRRWSRPSGRRSFAQECHERFKSSSASSSGPLLATASCSIRTTLTISNA